MNETLQSETGKYRVGSRTAARARIYRAVTRLPAIALLLQLSVAAAQEAVEQQAAGADEAEMPIVDTSEWRCKFCEFEEGWDSDFSIGIGYVSDDSFKFGEYNGLHEKGAYLVADGSTRYRSEDAIYLDLSLSDLGLDSRSLGIEGGRQGRYDLYLRYDEIPHYASDSASTPYLGGGGRLKLPAGWVTAGGTPNMTALDASLRDIDIETQRKRLGTGVKITTDSPWSYRADVRRDDKQGSKRGGGAFSFSSAQLVEPVDYVTDEIDAAVFYSRKSWQASLGYYASTFSNDNESLRWENAFNPIVPGADEGQLALPPDNEFQQVSLAVSYQLGESTHISGKLATGKMEQNEKLLQATINPALAVAPLPADSANAEVDTTNAQLGFSTMPTDRLRLSASYLYDDRDNKTPQLLYDWVTTDAFVNAQRANLPYSYTRTSYRLKADYEYTKGASLGVGYDMDERERTFQEVDKIDEDRLWGSVRLRNTGDLFVEFKLAFSAREASSYQVVPEVDPAQNLLMRKYNMADRDRRSISVFASFAPHPNYSVGLTIDSAHDDYDNSELGLTESSDNSVNLDVSALLSAETSLSAYIGRQTVDSSQAGSQAFAGADWVASNEDTFDIFGLSLSRVLIENTLQLGVDYSVARSRGEIELSRGAPFPDLRAQLQSIRLFLDYRFDENLSLRTAYWYETFDSDDWALEDVSADTVANLLAFGEESPSYRNSVLALSLKFRF